MPHFLLDNFDNPGLWEALDTVDNPSAEISVSADTQPHPFASENNSIRLDIAPGASGHLIRRTIAATDLTSFNSLTIWLHSDITARGTVVDPFRLRLSLGSALLPIGSAGNEWVRYLTAERADSWSYVVLELDDLPNSIGNALTTIEIEVVQTDAAHTVYFDALEARSLGMISDIDSALLNLLNGQLLIAGTPVPANIQPAAAPAAASQPAIRLIQYEAMHNEMRGESGTRYTDFTDNSHRIRAASAPWDIFYHINFISANREQQVAMVDFVISQLSHRTWLPIGNRALRIEQVRQVKPDDALNDQPTLRYRVAAWFESTAEAVTVMPVNNINVTTDLTTATNGGV